jgi:hypothetical protein
MKRCADGSNEEWWVGVKDLIVIPFSYSCVMLIPR